MRKLSLLGVFLTMLLFLVFASCTEEELIAPFTKDLQETKANAMVPFHGEYTTTVTTNFPFQVIESIGKATHLGKSTWDASGVLTPPDNFGNVTQQGTMEFTAANGAQLIGSYFGTANVFANPIEGSGFFIITEGTGRFDDATIGLDDMIWDNNDGTYDFTANLDGTGHVEFFGTLVNP